MAFRKFTDIEEWKAAAAEAGLTVSDPCLPPSDCPYADPIFVFRRDAQGEPEDLGVFCPDGNDPECLGVIFDNVEDFRLWMDDDTVF